MTKLPINTKLTGLEDRQNKRVNEIMRLLREWCGYLQVDKFHRAMTAERIKQSKFPMAEVQPNTWHPVKTATGKYEYTGQVLIYIYHVGNVAERAGEDMMAGLDMIDKLFSDNARGDLITAAPTHNFLSNVPFWIESELDVFTETPALQFSRGNEQLYMVGARGGFRFQDVLTP